MNVAYITKLGWKLCTESQKPWVKLIRSKYLRSRRVMDFQQTVKASSWIWNGIKNCKTSLDKGICYRIGQHSAVRIREDLWLPELPNYKLPDDLTIPDTIHRVRDLMTNDQSAWDVGVLQTIFPHNVYKLILSIPIFSGGT